MVKRVHSAESTMTTTTVGIIFGGKTAAAAAAVAVAVSAVAVATATAAAR